MIKKVLVTVYFVSLVAVVLLFAVPRLLSGTTSEAWVGLALSIFAPTVVGAALFKYLSPKSP